MTAGLVSTLGLFQAGCGNSALNGQSARGSGRGPSLTAQVQKFCQIVSDGDKEVERLRAQGRQENNPLRHDALQRQEVLAEDKMFDALYAFVGPSGEFTGPSGSQRQN